jgi:hypothetical protein
VLEAHLAATIGHSAEELMTRCPRLDQFELFLADDLDEGARARLERHVKGCTACQRVLETLTEPPSGVLGHDAKTTSGRVSEIASFLRQVQL